jgi:DNA-directed RNA polymerase beta subunit/intein/homing endonuclease
MPNTNNITINQEEIDKLIDLYFKQPRILYEHLFSSYNQLIEEIIPYSLIQEQNYFYQNVIENNIYLHGFKCTNIRIKPPTFDNDNEIKFPSDARKNHLNYFATIVADVVQVLEKVDILTNNRTIKEIGEVEKELAIGNVPVMVKSKYCSTQIKKDLHSECKYDPGGYFIVSGQEKVVMSIEKMVDNKPLVFMKKESTFPDGFIYTAQINSRKNDWADNLQIVTIKNRKDNDITVTTSTLVDVPLFILFRALGVETDQEIISKITYDLKDEKMINLLRSSMEYSIDDLGGTIKTREEAIEYLASKLRKNRMISQTDDKLAKQQRRMQLEKILRQDFLPHLGEDIPKKISYLGYMVNKLLNVWLRRNDPDDRDALQNKRIEIPGILIGQLFRQNWKKMLNEIGKLFSKKNETDENPINMLNQIKPSIIEQGIKTALATGIWGMNKTKKGVAQSLQRLSWVQAISYLRRVMAPSLDSSTSKVTSIRQAQNLQQQFICLTGESEVLMGNQIDTKLMKDIVNGDYVSAVNSKTLGLEPTFTFNKFGRMPEKLLEIITTSGRKIKATPEHPFLVNNNGKYEWKKAGDLTIEDKLIIRHTEKHIIPDKETVINIDDKNILEHYKMDLLEAGYLNKPINQERLVIIARLLGALNTDGNMSEFNTGDKKYYRTSFYLGEEMDAFNITDDINKLGFGYPSIERKISKFTEKSGRITTHRTWRVSKDGALSYLLSLLGGFVGRKTSQERIIPDWIMNGNKLIKREFLSGFQGGDGCKLRYKYGIGPTQQTTINEHLKETTFYMNQISQLFTEFDITTNVIVKKAKEDSKKLVQLKFNNSIENLVKYAEYIGWRYCNQKTRNSAPVIEDLLIRKYELRNNYNDFIKENLLENGRVSVNIKTIKEITPEMIYDFTVMSDHHSFVASSICTHNCPAETPEGAKIGIVKSLAMMSSITTQNTSQFEITKSILKSTKTKHPSDIDPLQMKSYTKIFLNGDWIGVCKLTETNEIYDLLINKRREGVIDKYTTISLDFNKKEIKIYFEGGRLIRPLLIVKDNKLNITNDLIEDVEKEIKSKDVAKGWKRILSKYTNLVEYEDVESSNYMMCADRYYRLTEVEENRHRKVEYTETSKINRYGEYRWIKYSHCDFHAWTQLGVIAGNIPFSNHNHSGRNIIHFSQAKQAISVYLTSYKDRMDISQILYYPQVPIVTTKTMEYNNCLDLPYGENTIVAIASYNGYNQEDSMVFNQSSIDRGIFRADTLKKYHSEIDKNPSTNQDDIFQKPDKNKVADMKQGNYSKLNEKGFAPEETEITNEDFIIGKVSPIQPTGDTNKVYKDSSEIFKSNVDGVIDRVHTGIYNVEGYEMYNVRVRMERIPVIGDKFSNRAGQKGTLGIALQQKDMPFTAEGMVPDLIMNPHCFVGDTLVALPNGLAKRIDSFSFDGLEKVLSWCPDETKSTMSYSIGMESKGLKETIKLTLIDGRIIECTPDHRFKIKNNDNFIWKEAKDITFNDKLVMSITGTEDKEYNNEDNWSLQFGDYKFNMLDEYNREKSLAFARLLGYIHTDGCLSKINTINRNTRYKCLVYMGSLLDANTIIDDIELVTGKRPKIQIPSEKENNYGKTYTINISDTFAKSLNTLSGMSTGRRTTQETSYPDFLFDDNCPLSIIREFLGGNFGGDGWCPHYKSGLKNTFSSVKFSQSTCVEFESQMKDKMEQFIRLLKKLNVDAEIVRVRDHDQHCQEYIDRPRISFEIEIKSNESFRKNIGFRHCVQKSLRLEIACCYENYCNQVKEQHNNILNKVNEYMNIKSNITEALEKSRNDLYPSNVKVLNEYYSLLTSTLVSNRRKSNRSSELNIFDYKYMTKAHEFINECGVLDWFNKGTYIVNQNTTYIPNYYLGIMKIEKGDMKEVFDIGVMEYHLFNANGCVVSNCQPSRMTIGQLVECVASKIGAIEGHFVDGTPYCDYDVRKMPEILEKLGYNKYGNETLYCGMTGRKMDAEIFMGPTYQVRLKHMTADKYHSRSRGPRQALTRQPLEGRSRDGGLKIGEMEKDAMIAHGMGQFIKERMMETSDINKVYVCDECGLFAAKVIDKDYYWCKSCHNSSRISAIVMPYAAKLLFQELMSVNILPRIRTEKNIYLDES